MKGNNCDCVENAVCKQTDDVVDETDDVIHDETCRVTVIVSGHNIRWNIYINTPSH
jgi:hypothetical protein